MKRVYYAGKIGKNDWRHSLYSGLRHHTSDQVDEYTQPLTISSVTYAGPYFISCDHGCYHGKNTHGVGLGVIGTMCMWSVKESSAFEDCVTYIKKADILFAYIDSTDCYGTISEIGYAKALGKPIYIVLDVSKLHMSEISDLWFVLHMGDKVVRTDDLSTEHDNFIKWTSDMKLFSRSVDLPSEKQLNYIRYLATESDITLNNINKITKKEAGALINYLRDRSKSMPKWMCKYFVLER